MRKRRAHSTHRRKRRPSIHTTQTGRRKRSTRSSSQSRRRRSLVLPDEMAHLYALNMKLCKKVYMLVEQQRRSIVRDRKFRSIDFRGRTLKQQKFSIVSFPGKYEKEWNAMTSGEERLVQSSRIDREQQVATACVFYPDLSDLYGIHAHHCMCRELYGPKSLCYKYNQSFDTWVHGKAPWGCFWFEQWKTNVHAVMGLKQQCVVVFFSGKAGDVHRGLGHSQKAEVQWLKTHKIPFIAWDVEHYKKYASTFARNYYSADTRV